MPNLKSNKYSTIIKLTLFLSAIVFFMVLTAQAQEVNERYVEVIGTSETEIIPDKFITSLKSVNTSRKSLTESLSPKNITPNYHYHKIHRSKGAEEPC